MKKYIILTTLILLSFSVQAKENGFRVTKTEQHTKEATKNTFFSEERLLRQYSKMEESELIERRNFVLSKINMAQDPKEKEQLKTRLKIINSLIKSPQPDEVVVDGIKLKLPKEN